MPDPSPKRRPAPVVWAVVAASVTCSALLAVALSDPADTGESARSDEPAPAAVEVAEDGTVSAGGELPEHHPGRGDPAIGMPLPVLSAPDLTGEPAGVGPGDGPRVIAVVAHWCPHCRAELPKVVELRAGGWPDVVDLTVVSTAQGRARGDGAPSEWLRGLGVADDEVLVDDDRATLAGALGTTAFPYLIGVDSGGRVRWRSSGGVSPGELRVLVAALTDAEPTTVTVED